MTATTCPSTCFDAEHNTTLCSTCRSERRPLEALPRGATVGVYQVGRILGRGGFAITYLGRDSKLGLACAIKEFLPSGLAVRTGSGHTVAAKSEQDEVDYDHWLRSFADEARRLAALSHPGVVRVMRLEEERNTAYIVMPYLEGESLQARHDARMKAHSPWTIGEIVALLDQVGDALTYVHEQKPPLLHRDLKPDNIYLARAGGTREAPLLLDFGAARSMISASRAGALSVIHTPGYAPIEQVVRGMSAQQGPRTDVYGLAATAYYLLGNRLPEDPLERHRIDPDPLVPLVRLRPDLPDGLAAAIEWGVARRPDDRPQSVARFIDALRVAVSSRPAAQEHAHPTNVARTRAGARREAASASPLPSRLTVPRQLSRRLMVVIAAALVIGAIAAGINAAADGAGGKPTSSRREGAEEQPLPGITAVAGKERLDQLYDRAMRLSESGDTDSAALIAKAGIREFARVTQPDADDRYHYGRLAELSGELAVADAQGAAILSVSPNHLLGLLLRARVAERRGDQNLAAGFILRLRSQSASEFGRKLPEYEAHRTEIDARRGEVHRTNVDASGASPSATGIISGVVTDEVSGQPLGGASISVTGTTNVAMSDDDGRYRIFDVPAKTVDVTVRRIGSASVNRSARVQPGRTATLNVALQPAKFVLDGIKTTGRSAGDSVADWRQRRDSVAAWVVNLVQREFTGTGSVSWASGGGRFPTATGTAALRISGVTPDVREGGQRGYTVGGSVDVELTCTYDRAEYSATTKSSDYQERYAGSMNITANDSIVFLRGSLAHSTSYMHSIASRAATQLVVPHRDAEMQYAIDGRAAKSYVGSGNCLFDLRRK